MACFIVPTAEAIVTTVANHYVKKSEKSEIRENAHGELTEAASDESGHVKFSTKLGWLNKMLWGGSALLAFEHMWHGEVVPFFPFLTAVETGEVSEMLAEMGTVGVTMAVLVTAIWGGMVAISSAIEKRADQAEETL